MPNLRLPQVADSGESNPKVVTPGVTGGKTCSKCNVTKPYTEFYKHKGRKDGHNYWCKPCVNASQTAPKRKKRPVVDEPDRPEYDNRRPHRVTDKLDTTLRARQRLMEKKGWA